MNKYINELIEISHNIGLNTAYIQGGGGNTSYKDDKYLYVKASGILLKNMDEEKGIAVLDLSNLNNYLNNPDKDENIYSKDVSAFLINNNKPSIEAGLHATIPHKFVIHSHSVYSNVIACSQEYKDILDNILQGNYIFIPYATPGVELIIEYNNILNQNKECNTIILQNHGFITFGDTKEEALNNHNNINEKIKNALKLDEFSIEYYKDSNIEKFLFPDQVVYAKNNIDKTNIAYIETIAAYFYILEQIQKLSLTPNYLTDMNVNSILGMDSEKYRAKLV